MTHKRCAGPHPQTLLRPTSARAKLGQSQAHTQTRATNQKQALLKQAMVNTPVLDHAIQVVLLAVC